MTYNPKSVLYWLSRVGLAIILGPLAVIALPIAIVVIIVVAIYEMFEYALKWFLKKFKIRYYDNNGHRITKDEYDKKILEKRLKLHEIKLTDLPHLTQRPFKEFPCYEDREYKLPYDAVAIIKTVPNKRIDEFLKEDKEWLAQLSAKYAIDYIKLDKEQFRKGMMYPQDFYEMRYGFIWRSPYTVSAGYGMSGNRHYYFELNPASDKSLRCQMEDMMHSIYKEILRF